MAKQAFFYIDDTIWVLRDLTRKAPKSIFEIPFFDMLKAAHDKYGVKTQLNLFYRTDFAYGDDEFTLAEVPDCYKAEFDANSDWLKFAFHAKQEFPDYPYVNISYEDLDKNFKAIHGEVMRFAGEKCFSYGAVTHWLTMSKAGVQALYDNGIRLLDADSGTASEYDGNPDSLPYGHASRLLQNRTPEARVFTRRTKDVAISRSVCSYNFLSEEVAKELLGTPDSYFDEETGMKIKQICTVCLNLEKLDEIEDSFAPHLASEFIGICDHEQYFYSDYYQYQPDYAEKIFTMGKLLSENGFTFIFGEDLA